MIENQRIDFAVVGAERAGSSTLYKYLQKHPHICMSSVKEPGYFAYNPDWKSCLDDYHKLFSFSKGQLCGEASTMYTWFPEYPYTSKSLFEYNPELKIIYLIRNPIVRMISQFSMWVAWGVIKNDPRQLVSNPVFTNRSRYWLQLRQYLDRFQQENIYLMISEELFRDPDAELRRLSLFFGVPFANIDKDVVWENPTVGQIFDLWRFKKFKQRGWVQSIIPRVPLSVRAVLRKPFERSLQGKPMVQPDILDILWRMVETDVCEIEKFIGRELPFWYPN